MKRLLTCCALLLLAACGTAVPAPDLLITQISFSQTVVLPGETVEMSAVVEGADDAVYAWTVEAGELSDPGAATTSWTAPDQQRLVKVTLVVTASDDREASHETDVVVGVGIDHDGDGFTLREGDCDDTDGSVYPGASDGQDGIDNDCDGVVDEGAPDADDDGDGWSDVDGDCDDGNDEVNPDAIEIVNGLDDNCDTAIDEGTEVADDDGDGFCESDTCVGDAQGGDCNDGNSAIAPGSAEILDGIDNNCDGTVDEGTAAYDDDGDGWPELAGDCDDASVDAHPGHEEIQDDADNDCDGLVDEDFLADVDGDGWSALAGDCDDDDFYVYPGAPEWTNGVDDDCNGTTDDNVDATDDDGDGFSEADGDCDDSQDSVYPGAEEVQDPGYDFDNDCDGYVFANAPLAVGSASASSTDTCTQIDLDATGSWDPDDDVLQYYWYFAFQPINSDLDSPGITGGGTDSASFTPDVAGPWILGLIVSDGALNSTPFFIDIDVIQGPC